jgi:hypothetical protein
MEKLQLTLSLLVLILAASLALSCGASSPTMSACASSQAPRQGQGQLQSITLSPASANAQNCPNGQVQFTATGHYVDPTQMVTPQSADWAACQQNAPTNDVFVTPTGLARCASGASGAYAINAFDPGNCNAINACGTGCTIYGTAQLTCP